MMADPALVARMLSVAPSLRSRAEYEWLRVQIAELLPRPWSRDDDDLTVLDAADAAIALAWQRARETPTSPFDSMCMTLDTLRRSCLS